jgi:raffinose/stachyose/melibiose transport system substrate-binding protein
MKWHTLRLFVGLTLFVLLMVACAPAASPGATGGAAGNAAAATTISFWYEPPEGGDAAACVITTVIDPFNALNNGIHVDAVSHPQAWDATRTAIAGGGGPDVVGTPGPSFVFELAKAGQLLPLDDFVESEGWGESFVPWALSLGKVDGKLYSLPDEQETLVLYYNKTLFDEKGWQPPKTIDELMALSQQIADADVIPFAHTNAEWRPSNEWFVGEFLNHVAGPQKVYEALTGKTSWEDPDFLTAINDLNEMQQKGWFMGSLDNYYTAANADRDAAFANGEAAMKIEGTWAIGALDEVFGEAGGNSNEWDWVPVPSITGDAIFDLGIGNTYSINKASKSPEAVAKFLTYFFSPEVQAKMLADCDKAPAPIHLSADALSALDARQARVYDTLSKSSDAGNYGYTTWTFWPPKSDVYIYEEIEKVWAGTETAEEYLAGLQKLFTEEATEGNIPPIPER